MNVPRKYLALLFVVAPLPAHAQAERTTYGSLSGGAAIERAKYNVRSDVGFSSTAAAGRQVSDAISLEARASMARFAAPTQIISPGGCLGASPCVVPTPSSVTSLTVGGATLYDPFHSPLSPFLVAGAGVRRISQGADGSEVRPYGELGVGVRSQVSGGLALILEARAQAAPTSRDFAGWILPIGLGVRF